MTAVGYGTCQHGHAAALSDHSEKHKDPSADFVDDPDRHQRADEEGNAQKAGEETRQAAGDAYRLFEDVWSV